MAIAIFLPHSRPIPYIFSHQRRILKRFNNSQATKGNRKMLHRSNASFSHKRTRKPSIRDVLEERAWRLNPGLANRLGKRLENNKNTNNSCHDSSRRIMRLKDRILLALSALLVVLLVIRAETASANENTWGLQMKTDTEVYTELALDTAIQLDITGLTARVEITQKFFNQGMFWAEGVYRFPLPEGAAVDRLLIKVGERLLEGEIQEKQTARRTYQKARDAGKTATLVEQQRRNQFETRLANIGPGESIEITIAYLQNVSYSDFSYRLRLPMTFTPRWEPAQDASNGQVSNPQQTPYLVDTASSSNHHLSLQANLVSSIELAAIQSRYHDVDIRRVDNGYQIELLNADERSDRDFELTWTPSLQTQPGVSLTTFNDGESVYAQLMLAPPLADFISPQAREVILIIDTSGSMEGASIAQAKAALSHALNSLETDDYFNLLQFNSSTKQLFDHSVAITQANLHVARNFIEGLSANGGTDMAPALKTALSLPEIPGLMRQVVFITDGAVGNETGLLKKVAHDLGNSRMFTVAIGSAPNNWFMRKTAEIGRGSYVHIGKPEEVEKQMSALWQRIQLPALTDICVNWGESAEFFPEIVPDLYAGEPLWLLARMPSQPTIIGLCGNLNGQDWNLDINGWDAIDGGDGGDNLAKLWARKKIESLQDSLLFDADPELTRLEITAVALEYGLLTPHTSLVAVDKTPRRPGNDLWATSNVPGLLPAGSAQQVAAYPSTATGWLAQLLLSIFVLLLASCMLLFSGSRVPALKQAAKTKEMTSAIPNSPMPLP
jgi:Ca-activated chloride channel family protein